MFEFRDYAKAPRWPSEGSPRGQSSSSSLLERLSALCTRLQACRGSSLQVVPLDFYLWTGSSSCMANILSTVPYLPSHVFLIIKP